LDGITISKWDYQNSVAKTIFDGKDFNCASNNGTKMNPCLSADIFGDWREELICRTADNKELRIFSTSIPTNIKLYTLMHNPQYRLSIAWQNVAYNQPPHTSYYLGDGMKMPPKPNIQLVKAK
jgi:rhamnogalacturonan endolyase